MSCAYENMIRRNFNKRIIKRMKNTSYMVVSVPSLRLENDCIPCNRLRAITRQIWFHFTQT